MDPREKDNLQNVLKPGRMEEYRLLQYVIENDRSAIALLNRELRYIYVSKRFLADYKIKGNILGKHHYEVFPDIPEFWKEVHRRALNGEVLSSDEDQYMREDGSTEWVRWDCRPWYESNGSVGGIILYTEVITSQKEAEMELIGAKEKAEENEKLMSDILTKLNEAQQIAKIGSWDWNLITGEVWWSDELYNIFEVKRGEYVPSVESNAKFIHPDDIEGYNKAAYNSMVSGQLLDYQLRIITQDGKVKHCKSTARVCFNNDRKPERMTGSFIDVTENVTLMNELHAAKEKAEESDQLKTAFLQNMSHEVRTPLNSIVGFSQLLSEPGLPLQKIKSFSKIITANSNRLIGIISDVIEISRIHSHQVEMVITKFDIMQSLNKIADSFREIIQLKDIDFITDLDIPTEESMIVSDQGKLEKIFFHIIDNAVKFTYQGTIRIIAGIRQRKLYFSVSDTGIGIAENKQKIIFDPFRQIETGLSRNSGGTGLGLTIVKAYIDALNGTISLKSEINRGTTVDISVPVSAGFEKKGSRGMETAEKNHGGKVLIAEDEYSNFQFLYEVLHPEGIEILHANNGREAVEICRSTGDLKMVLMDLKMPVMDGTSAAKQIRKFRPDLPIIAQTAYIPETENMDVFDDLITKPVNMQDLKNKVNHYLGVAHEM